MVKAFSVTSNPDHPGARRLARSAKFWGWDHTFLLKQDQLDLKPPYIVWRPTYAAEQLGWVDAVRKWPEEDFFFYVDAWDTVFTGPPQELSCVRGQLNFGGDTVLYSENLPKELGPLFPRVGSEEFPYVNAGAAWGDSNLFAELAADYLQHSPTTLVNQDYFNWRFIYELGVGRERLTVDTRGEVALNIMLVQKRFFEMRGNRVHYLPTDTYPLVVHAPGSGVSAGENAVPLPAELEKLYGE